MNWNIVNLEAKIIGCTNNDFSIFPWPTSLY